MAATLLLLLAVLLPAWAHSGGVGQVFEDPETGQAHVEYGSDLVRAMLNPWLLPALGLVWVVWAGGLDLSVWVVFTLAAALAARLAGGGASPLSMLGAVAGLGAAVGLVHGAAAGWGRLPSWGLTLLTATVGVSVVVAVTGGRALALRLSEEYSWPGSKRPFMLTGSLFILAMLAGLLLRQGRVQPGGGRRGLTAALVASGLLSALGGMCWLIRAGWTPRPGHLFADLRVAAAAALAGAAVLRGAGRGLLAGMLLPPAMLVATAWRQCVCYSPMWSPEASLLLLTAMVLAAQWTVARGFQTGPNWRAVFSLLAPLGVVVVSASAWETPAPLPAALRWSGLGLWALPAAAALAEAAARRARARR